MIGGTLTAANQSAYRTARAWRHSFGAQIGSRGTSSSGDVRVSLLVAESGRLHLIHNSLDGNGPDRNTEEQTSDPHVGVHLDRERRPQEGNVVGELVSRIERLVRGNRLHGVGHSAARSGPHRQLNGTGCAYKRTYAGGEGHRVPLSDCREQVWDLVKSRTTKANYVKGTHR